jgi:hypothetical protein
VRQNVDGTEFYFPPARNKGLAMTSTAFMLVFGTVTYFVFHRVPIIFPLAFGFFTLLMFCITVRQWLGTSSVVIGNGSLTLKSGLLGTGTRQQIPLAEIASITDRITAQQGGGTGVPYYDIELTLRAGKKLTLGRTVRDKHETEWLVAEMRRLAGLDAKSMSASTT